MSGAKRGFLAFLRDIQGNVLPLAAIGMLLSAALVGGGIDMSRAYRAQNRLQSACDSAVLAGRRAVDSNGFDSTAQTQASNFFTTNFNAGSLETDTPSFTAGSTDNGQTVTGTASADLNLAVMKIFGFKKFSLSVNCQASMGVGNSDVLMVLDTTGSMSSSLGSGTRISALQAAMKNFYTTVKTATAGTNARIRYGFVPFSSSVNVGKLLYDLNPAYLVDTYRIQSREVVYKWTTPKSTTASEYENETYTDPVPYTSNTKSYSSQQSCNKKQPNDTSWTNNGSSTSTTTTTTSADGMTQTTVTTTVQPQKVSALYTCQKVNGNWYIYTYSGTRDQYTYTTDTSSKVFDYWNYHQIQYDVSSYKAFQSVSTNTGNNGNTVSSTWAGCIEERGTLSEPSFSYSTTSGITPSGASDLDIDSAPTASDDSTKWAPMWPEVAYYRTTSGGSLTNSATSKYGSQASSYCPAKAQLLATMTQTDFNAYANSLKPAGSTYLDIGMAWGGRLISPNGIFASTVNDPPANGGEVSRHVIFMTDGQMEPLYYIQSAWGIEYHDRRVTDDGSTGDASRHTSRFLALCEAIKAKGIRVWTISFTAGSNSDLQTCASTNSYFNANDSTQLNAAFQEIAKQVGELRMTQ